MTKKESVWTGWISGLKSSEQTLLDIGVELGEWIPIDPDGKWEPRHEDGGYGTWENCTVSKSAMASLDPLWGTLIWDLGVKS